MPTLNEDTVRHSAITSADIEVVFDLVADVQWWNTFHGPSVHAEPLGEEAGAETYRHWWVVDDHTVRAFTATWRADRAAGTIDFTFAADADRPAVSGRWSFAAADGTTVTIDYQPVSDEVDADLRGLLDAVIDAANRHAERQDLVVDFEDPLFVSGPLEPAYDYLYDCAKWPDRIPHVVRLELEEPVPGEVQFFDMDTHTPDGVPHTTRSVRICLPGNKIVYKQIHLPALLDGHTGHWRFTPTREGVWLGARHTAVIKPSALSVLGEGTTVEDARRYLRKVLGTNSMGNLRFAKQHAEEQA